MEAQQPQQNQQPTEQSNKGAGTSSFLSRQTSARWTPTSDQIRILKELYYNNGVRSPSSEQIQKISARLRQYGKIEGKNVFYWFQNHKARERQKKRYTTTPTDHLSTPTSIPVQRPSLENAAAWKPDQDSLLYSKYPGVSSSSCSSPGMRAVGQMGSFGYGAMTMENNFRDCSISAGGSGGGNRSHNLGWDPYSSTYTLYNKRMSNEEDDEEDDAPEIETLPLFPMHGEDYNGCFYNTNNNKQPESDHYYNGWYRSDNGNHTSLELSLNSYTGRSMN